MKKVKAGRRGSGEAGRQGGGVYSEIRVFLK
jgi:hypothetical protein